MRSARYDAVADFYERGWADDYDDSVSVALFGHIGPLAGRAVLDVACGHGRIARELARRGARVVGVDVSDRLLDKARQHEHTEPLGITYVHADITAADVLPDRPFDLVVCSFGLTDIDDLDAALSSVIGALTPGGRFVFSMLHPCFAGGATVSGSWPTTGRYLDEGRWVPTGTASSLRRQVGATHRTLSTYINALARVGLRLDGVSEPSPPAEWIQQHADAAHLPVFLVAGCSR